MTKRNLCALWLGAIMLSGMIILEAGCSGPEEVIGVRFKSFANTGSREIYLGVPDLGHGDQRVERDYSWSSPGEHEITFILDRGDDKLIARVDSTYLEYPNLSENIELFTSGTCTLDKINSFVISVVDRDTDAQVDLLNFTIDNSSSSTNYFGDNTWRNYTFLNAGLRDGFRFDGTVRLDDGPFTGDEVSKVEIKAGCWLWP
jgi:hypothetical protein